MSVSLPNTTIVTTGKGFYQATLTVQFSSTTYSNVGDNVIITYIVENVGTKNLKGEVEICSSVFQSSIYHICIAPGKKQSFTSNYVISGGDLLVPRKEIVTVAYLTVKNCIKIRSNCVDSILVNTGASFTGFTGPTGPTGPAGVGSLVEYFETYVTSPTAGTGSSGPAFVTIYGTTDPENPVTTLIPFVAVTGSTGMIAQIIPPFLGFLRSGLYEITYNMDITIVDITDIISITTTLIAVEFEGDETIRVLPTSVQTIYPTVEGTYSMGATFVEELPRQGVIGPTLIIATAGFISSGTPTNNQVYIAKPQLYNFFSDLSFSNNVFSIIGILLRPTDVF